MSPEEEQQKRIEEENNMSSPDRVLFADPKKFVNSTRIYIAEGFFGLRLNIGMQPETFALPPVVAKSLAHFLSLQVKNYEEVIGPINWTPNVPSPIQQSDLNKSDSDESTPPADDEPKPGKSPKRKR